MLKVFMEGFKALCEGMLIILMIAFALLFVVGVFFLVGFVLFVLNCPVWLCVIVFVLMVIYLIGLMCRYGEKWMDNADRFISSKKMSWFFDDTEG